MEYFKNTALLIFEKPIYWKVVYTIGLLTEENMEYFE